MSIIKNTIPLADGTYTFDVRPDGYIQYISFAFDDGTPTGGTVALEARAPNSQVFEEIPVGAGNTVALSDARIVAFTGPIAAIRATVSGHVGTSENMSISVNSFGGPEVRLV